MRRNLSGRKLVITGAARGIGEKVARLAAARGARVDLIGLEPDRLRALAEDLGAGASWWEADVRDGAALRYARCPICGDHLLSADQPPQSPDDWERWWLGVTRQAIAADYLVHHGRPGPPHNDPTRLVHASCRRGLHARQGGTPAPTRAPSRLA